MKRRFISRRQHKKGTLRRHYGNPWNSGTSSKSSSKTSIVHSSLKKTLTKTMS